MDVLAETLDNRLREWRPEMAAEARARISEVIEMADLDTLDLARRALSSRKCSICSMNPRPGEVGLVALGLVAKTRPVWSLPGAIRRRWLSNSVFFDSREQQSTLWLRYGPSHFLRRIDPLVYDDFDVCKRLLPDGAVGRATRQFRHLSDKGVIFVAPVQDNLVFRHSSSPASLYRTTTARTCLT